MALKGTDPGSKQASRIWKSSCCLRTCFFSTEPPQQNPIGFLSLTIFKMYPQSPAVPVYNGLISSGIGRWSAQQQRQYVKQNPIRRSRTRAIYYDSRNNCLQRRPSANDGVREKDRRFETRWDMLERHFWSRRYASSKKWPIRTTVQYHFDDDRNIGWTKDEKFDRK